MFEQARVDSRLQGSRPGRGGGVMERARAEDPPHCNPWRGSLLHTSSQFSRPVSPEPHPSCSGVAGASPSVQLGRVIVRLPIRSIRPTWLPPAVNGPTRAMPPGSLRFNCRRVPGPAPPEATAPSVGAARTQPVPPLLYPRAGALFVRAASQRRPFRVLLRTGLRSEHSSIALPQPAHVTLAQHGSTFVPSRQPPSSAYRSSHALTLRGSGVRSASPAGRPSSVSR